MFPDSLGSYWTRERKTLCRLRGRAVQVRNRLHEFGQNIHMVSCLVLGMWEEVGPQQMGMIPSKVKVLKTKRKKLIQESLET